VWGGEGKLISNGLNNDRTGRHFQIKKRQADKKIRIE
jgi:hypothetical protein